MAGTFQWLIFERASRAENRVAFVAIRAGRGILISRRQGLSVDAQFVGLDRARERNLMLGQKIGIGVAGTAGGRQIFLGDRGKRIGRRHDLVNGAVAGGAGGRLGIPTGAALPCTLDRKSFTSSAWQEAHCFGATVAASLASCAEPWQLMHASDPERNECSRHIGCFLRVAGGAFTRNLCGCGISLMSVWQATQGRIGMDAGLVFCRSTYTLCPASDFRSGWLWQARQVASGPASFVCAAAADRRAPCLRGREQSDSAQIRTVHLDR